MSEIKFRQSGIGTYRLCPEAFRLDLRDELPDRTNDATHAGTALHAGVEKVLRAIKAGDPRSPEALFLEGRDEMHEYLEVCIANGVPLTQQNTWDAVRKRIDRGWQQWTWWFQDRMSQQMLGSPEQWEIEWQFEFTFNGVTFQGTMDFYSPEVNTVCDWKTGKITPEWEIQRWNVQSTIYGLAVQQHFGVGWPTFVLVYPGGRQEKGEDDKLFLPFPHETIVHRGDTDAIKMMLEINSILGVEQRFGMETPWPLRTDTWFCSEKWCGNWDKCVGATQKENQS